MLNYWIWLPKRGLLTKQPRGVRMSVEHVNVNGKAMEVKGILGKADCQEWGSRA
jgi:hypothetical protein